MSSVIKIFLLNLQLIVLLSSNLYAINKINVSGTVHSVNGDLLPDVLITLSTQKNSAVTNRFGEFDLGKLFPNDTIYVSLEGFQKREFKPSLNMEIKLFPKSSIQEKINNVRNGETLIIPPGVHYVYPDYNIDSTLGMSINYKTNVSIIGSDSSEIILMNEHADVFYIFESTNILIKNIKIGYFNSGKSSLLNISRSEAVDFPKALAIAKESQGDNSIFKYDGKLHHTRAYIEPFIEINIGKIININNSSEVILDSVELIGSSGICLSSENSKNIYFQNSIFRNGLYGCVFSNSENIKISKSIIMDHGEIYFQTNSDVRFNDNIVKISGYFVPEFVAVDSGSIEMLDESIIPPPKPIYLSSDNFIMSKKEITFDQFDSFCIATNRELPDDSEWGRGNRPVINISYNDALDYCVWLSELTGKSIRLPSVNEWEYAARGGIMGGDDNSYSGGNLLETVAWCKYNTNDKTEPVGLKKPNELGIFDMSGNVFEYCLSLNDSMIVLKGGSWANSGVGCRVSDEVVSKIDHWDDNIGFRVIED